MFAERFSAAYKYLAFVGSGPAPCIRGLMQPALLVANRAVELNPTEQAAEMHGQVFAAGREK